MYCICIKLSRISEHIHSELYLPPSVIREYFQQTRYSIFTNAAGFSCTYYMLAWLAVSTLTLVLLVAHGITGCRSGEFISPSKQDLSSNRDL